MIEQFIGTIGSGKSYHALERIVATLKKQKHVIANFPLNFENGLSAYSDLYMYVPDEFLMGEQGVAFLYQLSKKYFYGQEGSCLVVIDEAGNYFAPMDFQKPEQKLWRTFFTQSRKMGYDFILVSQTDKQINRTIRACVEYEIVHRKANNIFPFKYLPFTIFTYVKYWKQNRERLGSESSIFVKRFADLYDTHMMFGQFDKEVDFDISDKLDNFNLVFGNCDIAISDSVVLEVQDGGTRLREGPYCDTSTAEYGGEGYFSGIKEAIEIKRKSKRL